MSPRLKLAHPEPTESIVQSSVMTYLAYEPRVTFGPFRVNIGMLKNPRDASAWAGWSITWGDGKPARGFSDVLCAVGGVLVLMECKRPSTGLTGDQPAFAEYCEKGGTRYHVVRSVDDAVAVIKGVP